MKKLKRLKGSVDSAKIKAVKGMNDILPEGIGVTRPVGEWQRVEDVFRRVFGLYAYQEVRTPVIEETGLYARVIGEATDIVGKEMYTFLDRGGKKSFSLRPEGTAGVVRAYMEHSVSSRDPITKWWYSGPMYRYERVQAGRYRQFYQVGAEAIGVAEPTIDAELLVMLDGLLRRELGIQDVELYINTLGDGKDRQDYTAALRGYLGKYLAELCEDCSRRYEVNPLRALDCKVATCQPILEAAPLIEGSLSLEARKHFEVVLSLLSARNVQVKIKPRLVRGLDYYNRTCFEFVAGGLGAQNTICAGGRYDGLVETLGGPSTPAIGFAAGVERLLMAMGASSSASDGPDIFYVAVGEEAIPYCFNLVEEARSSGLRADMDLRAGSVKSQMRRADKQKSRFVAVIGDTEVSVGAVQLKDMRVGELVDGGPFEFSVLPQKVEQLLEDGE